MVLVNFMTFVVLKNVQPVPFSCTTVHRDLTFTLNVLSESNCDFAKFSIVLVKKNVVSFT